MGKIKCLAFDCFGTIFDMSSINRNEIKAYVDHVHKNDFSIFEFPNSWWNLKAHPDVKDGIKTLQSAGFVCVTLSNGSRELLSTISLRNDINWDHIIDLAKYKVYKPHEAAYATVLAETSFYPRETLMITANPTFGDVEGAAAIGMQSRVIRQPGTPQTIIELAKQLCV